MGIVHGQIHHSHPATLYLFVESTLILLVCSLEPMIGPTRATLSDLQLTSRDLHRWPWGFFGPPMPVTEKNPTQMLRCGKLWAWTQGSVGFLCFQEHFRLWDFES
jgi:hypothetical protein